MFTREEILSGRYNKHPHGRIFGRVKSNENGCMEFQGGLDSHGYGRIKINGHNLGTHKISYILCKGDIPDGLEVMHSCDNRKCVNPDHLSVGTHKENMQDMIDKKRNDHIAKGKSVTAHKNGGGLSFWYPSFSDARKARFYYRHIAKSIKNKSTYNGYHWMF